MINFSPIHRPLVSVCKFNSPVRVCVCSPSPPGASLSARHAAPSLSHPLFRTPHRTISSSAPTTRISLSASIPRAIRLFISLSSRRHYPLHTRVFFFRPPSGLSNISQTHAREWEKTRVAREYTRTNRRRDEGEKGASARARGRHSSSRATPAARRGTVSMVPFPDYQPAPPSHRSGSLPRARSLEGGTEPGERDSWEKRRAKKNMCVRLESMSSSRRRWRRVDD